MKRVTPSRVLAPVDLSDRSAEAALYAHRLAREFGSELILLHVLEPTGIDFSMIEPSRALLQELMAERTAAAEAKLDSIRLSESDLPVQRAVCHGDPAEQIIQFAKEADAELIVMPTAGRGRVREFLIGSVTAKVLHDSTIPVLTGVHLEPTDFPEFGVHHILCAIDFGAQSEAVLTWGGTLSERFAANMTAIHVVERRADRHSNGHAEPYDPDLARLNEHIASALDSHGSRVQRLIEAGDPHKVIAEAVKRLKTDLLIIGRGSANTVIGRLRAQAYGIVRLSPCPVLSV